MGVGIFTKYAKPVLGSALVLLMLAVSGMLYYQFRSPVGGRSPYETVNALYGQEQIAFTIEQSAYPSETESVQVTIRNDAEDTVVAPALPFEGGKIPHCVSGNGACEYRCAGGGVCGGSLKMQ